VCKSWSRKNSSFTYAIRFPMITKGSPSERAAVRKWPITTGYTLSDRQMPAPHRQKGAILLDWQILC
jgi:hypothetical protein